MNRLLLICDDFWHPAEVIEKGLLPSLSDYDVDLVKDAKDILTPEMLTDYDLIINCKGDNLTSGNPNTWFEDGVTEVSGAEFRTYVEKGGALLSLHAGNSFSHGGQGLEDYVNLVGNRFLNHPPRCAVTLHKEKDHPILEGVADEIMTRDEHYQLEITADDLDVFLTSTSDFGAKQYAGYTRKIGQGKVCVLIPGHNLSVWQNEDYARMVKNAVKWCLE